MVRIFGLGEGGVAVFLREQASVVVWDFDRLAFEEGVAEREEVLDLMGKSSENLMVRWEGGKAGSRTFSSCWSLEHTIPFLVLCGRTAVMSMNKPVSMSIHLASITLRVSS